MVCKCLHTCGVYEHESRTDSAFEELTIKQEVKDRSVQPGSAPLRRCLWPGKMCQAPSEKCRIPRPKSYMVQLTSLNLSPHCVLSATFVLISHSVSGRPWGRSPWSHSLSLPRLPVPGLLISPSSSGPSSPELSGTCPPLISPPIVLEKWQLPPRFMDFVSAFYRVDSFYLHMYTDLLVGGRLFISQFSLQ